jgi:hypothetical protein
LIPAQRPATQLADAHCPFDAHAAPGGSPMHEPEQVFDMHSLAIVHCPPFG